MTAALLATFTNSDTAAGTVPNADTGQAFTQTAGTGTPSWQIVGNQVSHAASLATASALTAGSGISDGDFSVKMMSLGFSNTAGLIIRAASASSNTYILLNVAAANFTLYKVVAGTTTAIGSRGHTFVAGDVLKIVATGSRLTASVGVDYLATVTETTGQTATFAGLRTDNAVTFDDLTASSPVIAADSGSNGVGFTYGIGVTLGKTALLSDGGASVAGSDTKSVASLESTVPSGLAGANVTGEAWVKIPAGNVKGAFVKIGSAANGWGFGVGATTLDTLGKKLILINEMVAWHVTTYSFGTGIYHVMVVRGASGAFTCYVNGSSVATGTMSSPIAAAGVIGVGGYGDLTTRPLSSTVDIDNVAMYASALSSARVTAHYNSGAGNNAAVAADSPVVWLKLDEGVVVIPTTTTVLPVNAGLSATAATIAKSTAALALAIGMTAVASTVGVTTAQFPISVGMEAVGLASGAPATATFPLNVGFGATASTIASTTAMFPIMVGFEAVGSVVGGAATTAQFPISVEFGSVGSVVFTTTAQLPLSIGFNAEASIVGKLEAYTGEPNNILIPVVLTGMMQPDLPPPVPPVDFAGIVDPSVAPTLVASDTAGGNLPDGTYMYAYAAWKGSPGQPSAPSPWSAPVALSVNDTVTLTYPTVPGADGYLIYRDDGVVSAAVDVTVVVAGSTVTSVDTGQPVGAYPADGSQTDPETNVPYDTGTVLVNDPGGFPQPADGNQSLSPIITLNSTQTWAVYEEPLLRNSLVFNAPTKFGRFHQPVDWLPVNEIVETWGKIQVIIDGKDVTYFRDHPAEMGQWSSNEPNGDAATSIYFPQISWFERPNHGELAWIEGGNNVDIRLVRPNGTRLTLFEGMVVGVGHDGQGIGITVNVIGCLYQADHTPYIQELYKKNQDIGTAIANIMDGAISRRYALCNRPKTGIKTNIRGSGGARLTQAVQDLLSTAFVPNATNQWTITNKPGRKPSIQLKNKTTHHWAMAIGHPGLVLNLTNDFQQMVSMVWGSGIDDKGGSWYNAKYPGIRIDDAPLYPLSVGQVFIAGDGHTGFDEFADQMRTRGYSMRSGDTYSTSDVDEVRDVQRRAGITIDGIVGAQTWTGVFGVGGSTPSLAGAHIAPLAAITQNVQYLERPDGSIIGKNPKYNKSFLAIGRLVEYGEGVTRAEGAAFARGEIRARIVNDPLWVGSATLTMDPKNGSRWEMRAGQNLFVEFMYAPLPRIKIDKGLLLHISQASVTPGGEVTLQLSYLGHDMTTLAAIVRRNKDTLDPARRGANNRGSRITQDSVIPWDTEAGGGKIPLHNLQGGFWTVFRIPAGQIGSIAETRYVCATGAKVSSINAFTSGAALPGAKEFAVAIFGKPVTANFLRDTVGNPLTEARTWTLKAAALEKAGLIQAYGASDQPAGHWPGQGSENDPTTGKLLDGQTWPWESSSPPYLWIAEYCPSSTRIAGQLRNSPLGT